ncbi:hypothetical protein KJ853_02600, partial [Patescibacteria group bacterium]|nr:hypothetical protein [Patescibacteria group bacterium]
MIFFKKFLVLFFLSCLAAGFWISPLLFKGYSPDSVGGGSLLARNLAISGKYSLENSQNIILSSTQVGEQGLPSSIGNRLTPQIYSYIIEIFGPLSVNKIVLVSVFLNALALLIFSLATLKLFGFKLAVLFSFVYMLLPSCWRSPYTISGYEFAILFFAVFLLFFVLAWQSKARLKIIYLIVSGLFLAFSALSKEAFWLMLPVIFIFFAAKRNWRSLLWFFASAILIIGVFYLPQFLSGKNSYLTLLFPDAGKINFSEYSYYAHLFPDPYTYHNLKDDFVKSQKDLVVREGIFNSLETRKVLANMGYESIGIIYRIILGFYLLIRHIFRFFSFETYGGPLIFILFILGI